MQAPDFGEDPAVVGRIGRRRPSPAPAPARERGVYLSSSHPGFVRVVLVGTKGLILLDGIVAASQVDEMGSGTWWRILEICEREGINQHQFDE